MTLKNKINLFLVIFGTISICLIAFIIYPFFSEIKKNSEDLIFKKQRLLSLEAKIGNLGQLQNLWQGIEPDIKKIDQLFIDPDVPVEFINFLEITSRDCDVSTKISPGLPTHAKKDPWPSLTFQITLVGSSPNFLKFLEKLEASPYLIEIKNLNERRLTEKELESKRFEKFSLGDVETTLSLKVYTK